MILHRKWLVVSFFLAVSGSTTVITYRLPNVYTSQTMILVDPQKVPESYVRSTVTGDVRNRLSTLSQQILSETRLQRIIDDLNLYSEERKHFAREEVILKMRSDISVSLVGELGGGQDLQAFKVSYSGRDPLLVAQVTNKLAALFIEENLKAREQQATGTTEFLENQLEETRKTLEAQEAKLRDFKLKHIGEMPEQQNATLQILGQLQSQLQLEDEALSRAEQQRSMLRTMAAQAVPVVDLDESDAKPRENRSDAKVLKAPPKKPEPNAKARLVAMLARGLTDKHPDVRKARMEVAEEEARAAAEPAELEPKTDADSNRADAASSAARPAKIAPPPIKTSNPVLESQLSALEQEIDKHNAEQQRLKKLVASYQSKLDAVPVREQEMTELVRDYEISKAHYSQLLEKQLSAETATQLEIRQKGERFSVLDPAQPAQKPSGPKRALIDLAGSFAGLLLGLVLALSTEFLGPTITAREQITDGLNIPVLEVIPVIRTAVDDARRRWVIRGAVSGFVLTILAGGAFLFYYYRA
jgi:polysaccharide chain length determinant protein (PEP-CTERM system associated)